MSARILGEHNNMTRSEVAEEVDRRRLDMRDYLNKAFADGQARLVIPKGAADSAEQIRAVILANGENINRLRLLDPFRSFPVSGPLRFPVTGSLRRLFILPALDPDSSEVESSL